MMFVLHDLAMRTRTGDFVIPALCREGRPTRVLAGNSRVQRHCYHIEFNNNQPMMDRTSAETLISPRLCASAAIQ